MTRGPWSGATLRGRVFARPRPDMSMPELLDLTMRYRDATARAVWVCERNEAGEAERERKDADDLSHWPAAVGYALWQVESPRINRLLPENAA